MLVVRDKTKKYDCKSPHFPSVFKAGPVIQSSQERTGCDWIHDGDMFLQAENKSSAPRNWSWTFLTSIQTVEDRGWPHYPWMPDGHISSLKVSSVKVGKKTISYISFLSRLTTPGTLSFRTTRASGTTHKSYLSDYYLLTFISTPGPGARCLVCPSQWRGWSRGPG